MEQMIRGMVFMEVIVIPAQSEKYVSSSLTVS
jgi:hypothetical protein